ncbi:hypothetical protein EFP23_05200 [Lacticaseibacillus paracasei]|nr:hypothetical protein [Lacticaseibacillus paracasei]RDF86233.1 hypothetical protein DQM24_01190 [Lacticaseibacillus paracasei]
MVCAYRTYKIIQTFLDFDKSVNHPGFWGGDRVSERDQVSAPENAFLKQPQEGSLCFSSILGG